MPSPRLIAWIVALAGATTLLVQRVQARQQAGGGQRWGQ